VTEPRAAVPPLGAWPLPREIEADPRHGEIRSMLERTAAPLWTGAGLPAARAALGAALRDALTAAAAGGRLVRGLESASATLAAERAGLAALPGTTAERQGRRASRLLLVTRDGAERFYRQVERLALAHVPRVLVVVLECDAATLGRLLYGGDETAKLVLTAHKAVAAAVLRALVAA
jgi:hypothetical protein